MTWLRSWWWKILAVVGAVFVALQFVPYRVDHPASSGEPNWDSPQTRALAERACFNCHSNDTKLLWFEHLAPISWYIANHVKEGRAALNFSQWHTAAGERPREAAKPLQDGEMPPGYYTYFGLHSDSKLSPAEVDQLVAGLQKTIAADPPKV